MPSQRRTFGLTTKSLVYAIGIHVFVAALLLVSFKFDLGKIMQPAATVHPEPVQAKVVTEAEVQKQLAAIDSREQKKKLEEQQAQKRLEDILKQTKEAEEKKKQEQKKLAEINKQKEAKKKKAEELAKKKKAEQKKKEELARKKEQERLAKAKQEEERKRLEAEKKKKAELARKKKEEEEKRAKELALQKKLEEERQQAAFNSLLAQYEPIIRQKVSRNWNRPSSTQSGIAAQVSVRLTATGEVISAKVTRSSGNSVFDRSVENAVYKASPLPIPQERGINEKFRNLNLNFRPEDLIS